MISSGFRQSDREPPQRIRFRKHSSTIKRRTAFGMAICIPISLWAISGFMISHVIFQLDIGSSAWVALACAFIISLVEGVVILSPKSVKVAFARIVIGIVMAAIGAVTIDLVIFNREVRAQLIANKKEEIRQDYAKRINDQEAEVHKKKADWDQKLLSAVCEGDGSCGTGQRSLGPRYKILKKEADDAKEAYRKAEEVLSPMNEQRKLEIDKIDEDNDEVKNAGLLDRVAALHERIRHSNSATLVFALFIILVFALELLVLSVKFTFGETIDDKKEEIEAKLEQLRLESYMAAVNSPVRHAKYCADRAIS